MSSSPCRAEPLDEADEQERGIYGGDPLSGEETVYAAKARAADTDGGTVGVLGDELWATGTDGPICPDCERWPARRAPLPPRGRSIHVFTNVRSGYRALSVSRDSQLGDDENLRQPDDID